MSSERVSIQHAVVLKGQQALLHLKCFALEKTCGMSSEAQLRGGFQAIDIVCF